MSEITSAGTIAESGVLITDQLYQRPCRPPDLEAEVQILRALGQQLTRTPQAILKYLVEAAVELCHAGTAGVSLIETLPSKEVVFRWVALAGVYEAFEGSMTDRHQSPCGVCLAQGCPQLYHHPERYFAYLESADPPIVEGLVVPLLIEGQSLGTIWIAAHDQQRQFDSEDVRIITSLADFTATALQSSRLRQTAEATQQALQQSQAQLQALVTNVPGMVYRYAPCVEGGDCFTFVNSGCRDLFEVEPAAALQNAEAIWSLIHAEDRAAFQASVEISVKQMSPWNWQGRIVTPSGQLKWVQGRSSVLQISNQAVWDGLLIDITERKQAELMLLEQNRLLELTASGHPLDECLSALCRSISKLNSQVRACILLANEQRSTFPRSITPEFPPSLGAGLKDAPINELAIGTCGSAVYSGQPIICADIANDACWSQGWRDLCVAHGILACHSTPVFGMDDLPLGSLMLCFDQARLPTEWEYQLAQFGTHIASVMCERDRATQALRESEELKQRILESSQDCIKVLSLDGQLRYISTAGNALLELENATAVLNAEWLSFWQGEDQENAKAAITAAQAGDTGRFQGYCPTMKGTPKWWDVIVTPIRNATGAVAQLLVTSREITQQRQAEAKLKERNQRLDLLYQTTRDLLSSDQPLSLIANLFEKLKDPLELDVYFNYLVDADRHQMHLASSTGVPDSVVDAIEWLEYGQAVCGMVAEQRCQIVVADVQQSLDPQVELIRSLGLTAYSCQPLIAQGYLFGTLSFGSKRRTQFTAVETKMLQSLCDQMAMALERSRLFTSLQQQTHELRQANRIKDEFLAVLSHELRSPLNPILGWSNLLRNRQLDAEKTAYALETIERNAKLQVQLIEDLLDVARIMRGKLNLNLAPVDLATTIRAALETVRLAAEVKVIQVQTRFEADVEPVLGDSARLQQIIWNLLTNAVKFTPPNGQVEIELKRSGTQAQIQVRDTGKGIHPDFLPHVFEHFRQADNTTTRKFGGLGLGLAIVRHLVELHGGTVQADSPGEAQGATFTVSLPLLWNASTTQNQPEQSAQFVSQSLPLAGVRVLLVDDETDTRDLIAFTLEQSGAIVTPAASAQEALQTFEQFRFDLLISDVGMPGMDGYMLLRQIRARSVEQGGNILAIALTAFAGEMNQQQAIAAGFQEHLSKPVEPEAVVRAISQLLA